MTTSALAVSMLCTLRLPPPPPKKKRKEKNTAHDGMAGPMLAVQKLCFENQGRVLPMQVLTISFHNFISRVSLTLHLPSISGTDSCNMLQQGPAKRAHRSNAPCLGQLISIGPYFQSATCRIHTTQCPGSLRHGRCSSLPVSGLHRSCTSSSPPRAHPEPTPSPRQAHRPTTVKTAKSQPQRAKKHATLQKDRESQWHGGGNVGRMLATSSIILPQTILNPEMVAAERLWRREVIGLMAWRQVPPSLISVEMLAWHAASWTTTAGDWQRAIM